MHIYPWSFLDSWHAQEYLDSNLFIAGDGGFCVNFPPSGVFETQNQICRLCNRTFELHFLETHFYRYRKSGNYDSRKVTNVLRNPFTLSYPRRYKELRRNEIEALKKMSSTSFTKLIENWQEHEFGLNVQQKFWHQEQHLCWGQKNCLQKIRGWRYRKTILKHV